MIKLSDYLMKLLVKKGFEDVFLVSGGGVMHLVDSVGKTKGLNYVACHHEQACAIGAESYARVKGKPGLCLVTTGPGGTNAITGVASAWVDSVPMLVISGQVRTQIMADYGVLRQMAPQEINIVDLVKPVTKYAVTIKDPHRIKYHLQKALYLAQEGRPGPVWIDIPLNIQGSIIDRGQLKSFSVKKLSKKEKSKKLLKQDVKDAISLFKSAKRPVLILGHGVRLSGGDKLVSKLIREIKAPVILPYNGLDLVAEENPYLVGKFGPLGSRRGNFVLQNSDLVFSIGASLNLTSIGFDFKGFAPQAKKIMVNIDPAEMNKKTLPQIDCRIQQDAKEFMEEFLTQAKKIYFSPNKKWEEAYLEWKKRYPTIIEDFYTDKEHVNSYVFFDKLSDQMKRGDVLVTGNSLDSVSMYQAFKVKKDQRIFTNKNFGGMGWGLPASTGACIGNHRRRTILVTGDGSIQFNLQELGTIALRKLPIKIFIINNGGYESIRTMQDNHFKGRYVGAGPESGVGNPDFEKLSHSYKIKYLRIKNNQEIESKIKQVFKIDGPVICDLNVSPIQKRMPRTSSHKRKDGSMESRPLEDMWPFLSRKEVRENMSLFNKE